MRNVGCGLLALIMCDLYAAAKPRHNRTRTVPASLLSPHSSPYVKWRAGTCLETLTQDESGPQQPAGW